MILRALLLIYAHLAIALAAVPAIPSAGSLSASSPVVPTDASLSSGESAIPTDPPPSGNIPQLEPSPIAGEGDAVNATASGIPASQNSFAPFPTPSQESVAGVFTDTDPQKPPAPGAQVVPNFQRAWSTAFSKAKKKVAGLTLEEKVSVTTGTMWMNGGCLGTIPPIEPKNGRGWPGLCLQDAPLGVRSADFVTAFPAGINAASTFNRTMMRERGQYMGREHKGKGVNIALGPMTNMARIPQAGRSWEGFGADPFLSGEAVYETVLGMQSSGVGACVKHLVGNEQEFKRSQSTSEIDDRTMHELYAHPFLKAVMAGVSSMMCSYNLLNGTYACENDKIMNDIVKREYGFQGFILSDWWATHSTMSAATGLDMTMPGDIGLGSGTTWFGSNLTDYVHNKTISETRIDNMATRIIAAWYYMKQDAQNYPKLSFDSFRPDDDDLNAHVDVQENHSELVRLMGAASTVLLKNKNGTLPLGKSLRSLVVIGSDAGPGRVNPNGFADHGGNDGVLAMGWGSGTANFTYLITPLEAIQARARAQHTSFSWMLDDWDLPRAGNVARKKGAAIVFINSDSGEEYITVDGNGGDRKNLTAWHGGDDLVLAVAEQNSNTIVVVHTVGQIDMEKWVDHPNVTAVLWAGLPGQEAGNSLADVLFGDFNPSGRLPYTIAKNLEDYPVPLITGGGPNEVLPIPYDEGLFVDYRHFDAKKIEPRYEFGFGLSYTAFAYSNVHVSKISGSDHSQQDLISAWEQGKPSPMEQGSSAALWLHRPAFKVTFKVKNTGRVAGGEIPQLYLHLPSETGEPPSLLKGFADVFLRPGQTESVTMTLSRYDLSIWDVLDQGWKKANLKGATEFSIGASSRDFKLKGQIPS